MIYNLGVEDLKTYASYAILQELNRREFREKLKLFPAELRQQALIAAALIGAETARRLEDTPEAVVTDSAAFAAELQELAAPDQESGFGRILEAWLIETLKDELRFCCSNCRAFSDCLALESDGLGEVFRRRAGGEDSEELRNETDRRTAEALSRTPYLTADDAQLQCGSFVHLHTPSSIGTVFNRYADIAASLRHSHGADYRTIQQAMIALNMEFCAKAGAA